MIATPLIILPYLGTCLNSVARIDIIWDEYFKHSLKESCREARGKGLRRYVTLTTKIPKNFAGFLRDNENKKELLAILSKHIGNELSAQVKEIYTTYGQSVLTSHIRPNLASLSPWNHEEVNTRAMLHVADATHHNFNRILIRANDIDSVVIAISCMQDLNIDELWIAYGTGKAFKYIPIHLIVEQLGHDKSRALLAFHASTVWRVFPELTHTLLWLSTVPNDIPDNIFATVQDFVIRLYKGSNVEEDIVCVNAAREELFSIKVVISSICHQQKTHSINTPYELH